MHDLYDMIADRQVSVFLRVAIACLRDLFDRGKRLAELGGDDRTKPDITEANETDRGDERGGAEPYDDCRFLSFHLPFCGCFCPAVRVLKQYIILSAGTM